MPTNAEIAERFERLTRLMEVLGADRFRIIAHQRAARTIEGLAFELATIASDRKQLTAIDGIGPKIADKIAEFCSTGSITELTELEAQVPRGVIALMNIPGLGPKTAATLWKDGGITDLAGLKRAIADGTILTLARMGEKSVEKLRQSISLAEEGLRRQPLGIATAVAERVIATLRAVKGVDRMEFAGSMRRGKETSGDIDILATMKPGAAPSFLSDAFRALPDVRQVLTAGETRSSVILSVAPGDNRWGDANESAGPTVQADLRILPPESWGAALMYFTGSKEHNIRMRERALRMGLTLNEYGLYPDDKDPEPPHKRGLVPVASATEQEIFEKLGLPFIPPEIREDHGELALKETPPLVSLNDIRSELHAHTTASDGGLSIEELAAAAKARGFHTIAVTDHSKSSFQANGLSVDRLMQHVENVRKAAEKTRGITILAGSEVDILSDGSLDYDDDVLRALDIVVASPHAALSQETAAATARLVAAVRHPRVHILGHPTGRLINRRAGLSPDMAAVIQAARESDTALEINAHWLRLDLRDVHVRAAVEAGCHIAIDCDVHENDDFGNLRFGVATARRGWLTPAQCINAWDARKLHRWLKSKR